MKDANDVGVNSLVSSNNNNNNNNIFIDLSNFDTSNVTDMDNMFSSSQATTGYARTQADADKFNSSSNKSSALNFVVKP